MYIGVDLGTSGIKVVLLDPHGKIVDSSSEPLTISRPQPLWSEQDPNEWWTCFLAIMEKLAQNNDLSAVVSIGLSGQMHGATLLDNNDRVLRPAILWNDGRCESQCKEIESSVPNSRQITGNIMMPGFTAPKLLWVKQHEPDVFAKIAKVLLPKDFLRYKLSGDYATDMSDAAGTMWLDVKKRQWHEGLLAACGLHESHMPKLYEGQQITGQLDDTLASSWGMKSVSIVAGGGDNAAGAVGVGLVNAGQAMISLGTSGVYFVVTDGFCANPDKAVHSFCHAIPKTWHLMCVLLSAASCLQWYAQDIVKEDVTKLLQALADEDIDTLHAPIFLPYLSGERTPHNNPNARGSFFGLTHETHQALLTHSILEGVSFAFADGVDALHSSGVTANEITLIGGGAKSTYWRQMLADILNVKITYRHGGDVGPALGAARLALVAHKPDVSLESICPVPELAEVHTPNSTKHASYCKRRDKFQALYTATKHLC